MDSIETQGKTVEQAVKTALDELGVSEENADVEVLDEGHGGLFGIGGSPASVRVTVKTEETVDDGPDEDDDGGPDEDETDRPERGPTGGPEEVLGTLLDLMDIEATINVDETDEDIYLSIDSEDAAVLIGRRGKCLNSLQFILNRIVSRGERHDKRIIVDVEGYRERRRESLTAMAERSAEKAVRSGREVQLQPLDPQDRRTVHIALREYPGVDTHSVGEGLYRTVIVTPEGGGRSRGHDGSRDR